MIDESTRRASATTPLNRTQASDATSDDVVTVAAVMHVGLVSCAPSALLSDVAELMQEHRVHKVVVPRPDGRLGVISEADLLHNGGQLARISAGELAHDGASSVGGEMPLSDAVSMLKSGEVEIFVIGAVGSPIGTLTAADAVRYMARPAARRTGTAAEVMSAGVVVCHPDASGAEVARAMQDNGARLVVVLDMDGEAVGVIDQVSLLRAWDQPGLTAVRLMNPNPLTIAPDTRLADAAAAMAAAGEVQVLVEPPAPPEGSGRWSEWKERGLPRGILTVQSVLEILATPAPVAAAAVGSTPTAPRRPWLVAVIIATVLLVLVAAVLVLAFNGGTCPVVQIGHARC